jgi:hypothetical protein
MGNAVRTFPCAITCFSTEIPILPNLLARVTCAAFAQAQVYSSLLTLFYTTQHSKDPSHQKSSTFNEGESYRRRACVNQQGEQCRRYNSNNIRGQRIRVEVVDVALKIGL